MGPRSFRPLVAMVLAELVSACSRGGTTTAPEPSTTVTGEAVPADSTPADPRPSGATPTLDDLERSYQAAAGRADQLEPIEAGLEQFLAEHPDDPTALMLLSQVELELGRLDDSLATAERCVAVSASESGCWLTIGVIAETKGASERAIDGYRRYAELAPNGRYAPDVHKALARLGAEPSASNDHASIAVESITLTGEDVDERRMRAVIGGRASRLAFCHPTGRTGRITFTIRVHPRGYVDSVTLDADTVGDTELAACTSAQIHGWRFPKVASEVRASFTLAFAPS